MKKRLSGSYLKIFCIILIAGLLNTIGSFAQTNASVVLSTNIDDKWDEIENEWVNLAKDTVEEIEKELEENEKELIEKIVRELITNIRNGVEIPEAVGKVIEKYKYNKLSEEDLIYIGEEFYDGASKVLDEQRRATDERNRATDEMRQATDEMRQATDERNRATDERKKRLIEDLPAGELELLSLKKYKDRSLEWIKSTFKEGIQGKIDLFIKYDYFIKQETMDWLKELGISTEGLKAKD